MTPIIVPLCGLQYKASAFFQFSDEQ